MPYNYYNNPYKRNFFQRNYIPVYHKPNFPNDFQENSNICKQDNSDNILFEIFGIKLYFDDVLILSLLFFLYKEEVKDESLFLSLILLLIS